MSEDNIEGDTIDAGLDSQNLSNEDSVEDTQQVLISGTLQTVTPSPTSINVISAIINGAGIGLLLGILVGLSISPVVSGVIGTLSGLLAILIGINEKYISVLKSIRIGAFGFFCVAGVLLGMAVRINKLLLPSHEKMMIEYIKIGFEEEEARDFVAFREFGLVPAGWIATEADSTKTDAEIDPRANADKNSEVDAEVDSKVNAITDSKPVTKSKSKPKSTARPKARTLVNAKETVKGQSSLLYSSEVNADACGDLIYTTMALPKEEVRNNFSLAKGTWKEMATVFDPMLPDDVYKKTLLGIKNCFCEGGMTGGNIKVPKFSGKIDKAQSLANIKKNFKASADIWQKIEKKISSSDIPEAYQKIIFLNTYKILSHD